MSTKKTEPRWVLNDYWAVDVNSYNWILYHTVYDKSGNPIRGKWANHKATFYPTPEKLLKALYQKMTMQPDTGDSIEQRISNALSEAISASNVLMAHLATLKAGIKTLPPSVLGAS